MAPVQHPFVQSNWVEVIFWCLICVNGLNIGFAMSVCWRNSFPIRDNFRSTGCRVASIAFNSGVCFFVALYGLYATIMESKTLLIVFGVILTVNSVIATFFLRSSAAFCAKVNIVLSSITIVLVIFDAYYIYL